VQHKRESNTVKQTANRARAQERYRAKQRELRNTVKRIEQQHAARLDRASVSLATFYSLDNVAQLVRELNTAIYGAR
jgi:predicted YcjX-like family ATPase